MDERELKHSELNVKLADHHLSRARLYAILVIAMFAGLGYIARNGLGFPILDFAGFLFLGFALVGAMVKLVINIVQSRNIIDKERGRHDG